MIFHHFVEGKWPPKRILNFSIFQRRQSVIELLDTVFGNSSSKGSVRKNNNSSNFASVSRLLIFMVSGSEHAKQRHWVTEASGEVKPQL